MQEASYAPRRRVASKRLLNLFAGAVLVVVISVTYAPVLGGLVKDWIHDPNYNHGLLIPLISGYLIWKSRGRFRSGKMTPSAYGLAGLLVAVVMLVVGTAGAEVFTQRLSLILLLSFLLLFLYGRESFRVAAFPLAFLFFAIPLPYVIYYSLTSPMQAWAAKCAVFGLKSVGVQAINQGNIIHLPEGSLEVAEACSGIRSLYAFLALGALVAHAAAISVWGRLAVFSMTIPLAVAGNAIRVWGSGLGVYLFGPDFAKGTVHELFGLMVFSVSLCVFVLFRKAAKILCSSATLPPLSSSALRESTRGPSALEKYPGDSRPRSSKSPPS